MLPTMDTNFLTVLNSMMTPPATEMDIFPSIGSDLSTFLNKDDALSDMSSFDFLVMDITPPSTRSQSPSSWAATAWPDMVAETPSVHLLPQPDARAATPKAARMTIVPSGPGQEGSVKEEEEDDALLEDRAVQALVTTRSGRMVRQMRYAGPAPSTDEALRAVAARRRRILEPRFSGGKRRLNSAYMAEKRDSHNVSERQRRAELKDSLDELRVLIPAVKDDHRVHACTVLQETIAYIRTLEAEDQAVQAQLAEERVLHTRLSCVI